MYKNIMHYDQKLFFKELVSWFDIKKLITVIYHINQKEMYDNYEGFRK
jgi:hypothetical protein